MITIASILVFMGFYAFYYTSKRAVLHYDYGFEQWMQNNTKPTKTIGCSCLILAYSFLVFSNALGSGTLIFFIQLMVIGSLIVLLTPLKKIKNKIILAIFITALLFEMY
jgi:hypothetical protein